MIVDSMALNCSINFLKNESSSSFNINDKIKNVSKYCILYQYLFVSVHQLLGLRKKLDVCFKFIQYKIEKYKVIDKFLKHKNC